MLRLKPKRIRPDTIRICGKCGVKLPSYAMGRSPYCKTCKAGNEIKLLKIPQAPVISMQCVDDMHECEDVVLCQISGCLKGKM